MRSANHRKPRPVRTVLRRTLIPAVVGASLVGGFAFATFTMHSEPWATGETATVINPHAEAEVVGTLWPGQCNDISVTFENHNELPVSFDETSKVDISSSDPRTLDFLTYRGAKDALTGKTLPAGDSATFTIPDAICLDASVDDARQGKDLRIGLFIASHIVPGTEAPAS